MAARISTSRSSCSPTCAFPLRSSRWLPATKCQRIGRAHTGICFRQSGTSARLLRRSPSSTQSRRCGHTTGERWILWNCRASRLWLLLGASAASASRQRLQFHRKNRLRSTNSTSRRLSCRSICIHKRVCWLTSRSSAHRRRSCPRAGTSA